VTDRTGSTLERAELKRTYRDLFERFSEILFRHDPVGINLGDKADEYEPEVGTILPRMASAISANDVQRIAREELAWWFGGAGIDESRLEGAAAELWAEWQKSRLRQSAALQPRGRSTVRRDSGADPEASSHAARSELESGDE
jgi:hypothetical protein